MKILLINTVCGIKSTGRICTDLATALDEQGHEVKIAYGRGEVPEKYMKYAIKIGSQIDVLFHAAKSRLYDSSGFESKKVTEVFIKWIEEFNPDVIHLHNLHGYYINIELLFRYLRRSEKRIIWTLHDAWAFTGHTPYCDSIGCTKWIDGCYECPLIHEYPKSFFDRSSINWKKKSKLLTEIKNTTIVTPSKWLAECVKKSYLKSYPVLTINNGIDTKKFYPKKNNFKSKYSINDKFMLLGVATAWDRNKGLQDYYELSNYLNKDYQIVLVGLSKNQIDSLPNSIIGINRTNDVEELVETYSAADLFLNLSYCENYPTVNIEALACGTPVLTYDTGGSPEIVKKYGGVIVDKGDIRSVINEIEKFEKKSNNLDFNREKNDITFMLDQYLSLYENGIVI